MSLKNYVLSALCFSAFNVSLITTAVAVELKNEPKLQAIADQLIAEE